jgi:hypothetical protein
MSKIIEIQAKDLIVGEIYQDIDEGVLAPIYLKLIKKDKKEYLYEPISEGSENWYSKDENGLIVFSSSISMYKKVENE